MQTAETGDTPLYSRLESEVFTLILQSSIVLGNMGENTEESRHRIHMLHAWPDCQMPPAICPCRVELDSTDLGAIQSPSHLHYNFISFLLIYGFLILHCDVPNTTVSIPKLLDELLQS